SYSICFISSFSFYLYFLLPVSHPFPTRRSSDLFIGSVCQPQRAHVGPGAREKRILGNTRSAVRLDRAIQAHGGAGVSEDTFLASAWANVRTLRLADGPDEEIGRASCRERMRDGEEEVQVKRKRRDEAYGVR